LKENIVEGVEVVKESKDEGMKLRIRLICYKYLRKWRKCGENVAVELSKQ